MRHRKAGFKLQRNPSARRALLRGLASSVILRDRVITTVTKAKAVKPVVEKMITLGKRDTLHARRQAASYLQTSEAVKRLFDTLAPRFAERSGGYTRIVRLGPRKGDGAEMALVEILGAELKKRAEERRKRREDRMKQQQEEGATTEEQISKGGGAGEGSGSS